MTADQLTLAGIRRAGVGDTRDPGDRHFTPFPLARIVVEAVDQVSTLVLGRPPRVVVEPSVGGGTIARAVRERWPTALLHGVDIDEQCEGRGVVDAFTLADWVDCSWPNVAEVVVGNPPFTGDTAIAHIRKARDVAPIVGFILPWEAAGAGREDDYWTEFLFGDLADEPVLIRPVVGPRPWPNSIRQAAVYVWAPIAPRALDVFRGPVVRPLPRWKP